MLFLWTTFVLLLAICCARTEKAGMSQFDSMKSTDSEFVQKLLKERFNWKYFIEALQQHEKSQLDMKVDPCLLSFVQIDREELLKGKLKAVLFNFVLFMSGKGADPRI